MTTQSKQKDALEELSRRCKMCIDQFVTQDELDATQKDVLVMAMTACYDAVLAPYISHFMETCIPDVGNLQPMMNKTYDELDDLSDKIANDILEANDHCIQRDSKQNIKNSIMLSLLKDKYIIN